MAYTDSLRNHPEMAALFKAAESRHLTEPELGEYLRVFPQHADRATAAREIATHEIKVVKTAVEEVFVIYPYEEHHYNALAKCTRDVRYVSAYATQAMLMNDPDWLRDKLLLWLKTILQSFEFPDRAKPKKVLFATPESEHEAKLSAKQRSIYETYHKLKQHYQKVLTPASYQLISDYLQMAADILPGD